jgi:hypothetical protein
MVFPVRLCCWEAWAQVSRSCRCDVGQTGFVNSNSEEGGGKQNYSYHCVYKDIDVEIWDVRMQNTTQQGH